MLGMKWRVWEEKVILLMRIRNHDQDTLCRQIYEEGKSKGWPGLANEVTDICNRINIPDVNETFVPKSVVKKAIRNHHYKELKEEIASMKKLDPIKDEDFRNTQSYFTDKSIENGRMSFRIRCQMVDNIPRNFKNKYRKEKKKLICRHCDMETIMTQSHCLDCPGWSTIREDLDLTKIDDLVKFFRRLLSERARSDKEDGLQLNRLHCTTPYSGGHLGKVEGATKYASLYLDNCAFE